MVGSFAKVLLMRGQKDVPKGACQRVDSLGLAKRRLQKQHDEAEAGETAELAELEPDADGIPAGRCRSMLLPAGSRTAEKRTSVPGYTDATGREDSVGVLTPLASRQLTDSIRLARVRLRAHHNEIEASAAADVPGQRPPQRTSWSSERRPADARAPVDQEDDAVEAPVLPFRRASDGEYLTTAHHQSGSRPSKNALKRLFRKLTSPLEDLLLQAGHHHHHHQTPSRPRSATHSRGGSPNRHPSAGRVSSTGPSSSRRRSSMDHAPASPAPQTRARAAAGPDRRSKRQSAPGELFAAASPGGGSPAGGTHDAATPPCAHRPGSAVSAAVREPSGKSRNWLTRLSIGLSGASSRPATPPPPAAAATAAGSALGSPPYRGAASATAPAAAVAVGQDGGRQPRQPGEELPPQSAGAAAADDGAGGDTGAAAAGGAAEAAEAGAGGAGLQQCGLPPVRGAVAVPAGGSEAVTPLSVAAKPDVA
ncbi:hypothetical protein TSOC_012943 [Tetrabaena socialis]|uniref:Uncharacterized protein n=1 Tax=Tetrabaena socialis TaxID=47790 RepID=A0A2J7ZLP6_9CHLO|nr:hypothetical protein TSOC_012943 [Tetrabaena socialis]|eukprot:PNH01189.1 hypothetical protein TSOC_012943 [Tetrabaena socialis]